MSTNLVKLGKFQSNPFFKEGIHTFYNSTINQKTADLLAKYIAMNLKNLKRHNFFLGFIKNALKMFISKNFSKIKKIQIQIKGRFNGVLRAKKRTIIIGKNIPLLTINSNINYSEATSYNLKGTFGVKIWIYEKKKFKLC